MATRPDDPTVNDNRSDDPNSGREFAYGRSWQEYLARHSRPGDESEEEPEEREAAGEESAAEAEEAEAGVEKAEATSEEGEADAEEAEPTSEEAEAEPEARETRQPEPEIEPTSSRIVVPPEEEEEFGGLSRRRRRTLTGVLAVLALAVAALVVPGLLSSNGEPEPGAEGVEAPADGAGAPTGSGEATGPGEPGAAAVDTGAGTASTGQAGADRPVTDRRITLFSARADSVADAVASYRERRRDFDLSRIGCDGLARGLREVRAAYSQLTAVYEPVRDRIGVSATARYQRLTDDVSGVERSFAATECAASS